MADTKNETTESMFINVDFKNHPDLFYWVKEQVERNPDIDRSTFMRRLVRREMKRVLSRKAQQNSQQVQA